jgi:hypothetical protein
MCNLHALYNRRYKQNLTFSCMLYRAQTPFGSAAFQSLCKYCILSNTWTRTRVEGRARTLKTDRAWHRTKTTAIGSGSAGTAPWKARCMTCPRRALRHRPLMHKVGCMARSGVSHAGKSGRRCVVHFVLRTKNRICRPLFRLRYCCTFLYGNGTHSNRVTVAPSCDALVVLDTKQP